MTATAVLKLNKAYYGPAKRRSVRKSSKKISRRTLLGGTLAAAIVPVSNSFAKYIQASVPLPPVVTDDPTKIQGLGPSILGKRSPYENPIRKPSDISSRSPLQNFYRTLRRQTFTLKGTMQEYFNPSGEI